MSATLGRVAGRFRPLSAGHWQASTRHECPVVSQFWTTPRYSLPSACAGFPEMGHFNDSLPPERSSLARNFPKMSSDRPKWWPKCPKVGHDETLAPPGRRKRPSDCPTVWTVCPTLGQKGADRGQNPKGIPSLSPGLARNAGLPWVGRQNNLLLPQRGCVTPGRLGDGRDTTLSG